MQPASGDVFPFTSPGPTTTAVNCTATDDSMLTDTASFNVTVQDTSSPQFGDFDPPEFEPPLIDRFVLADDRADLSAFLGSVRSDGRGPDADGYLQCGRARSVAFRSIAGALHVRARIPAGADQRHLHRDRCTRQFGVRQFPRRDFRRVTSDDYIAGWRGNHNRSRRNLRGSGRRSFRQLHAGSGYRRRWSIPVPWM